MTHTPTRLPHLNLVHCMESHAVHTGVKRWEPNRLTQWWESSSLPDGWQIVSAPEVDVSDQPPPPEGLPDAVYPPCLVAPGTTTDVAARTSQFWLKVNSPEKSVTFYVDEEVRPGSWDLHAGPYMAAPGAPVNDAVPAVPGRRYHIRADAPSPGEQANTYWTLDPRPDGFTVRRTP